MDENNFKERSNTGKNDSKKEEMEDAESVMIKPLPTRMLLCTTAGLMMGPQQTEAPLSNWQNGKEWTLLQV